ncbi:hypothetical protein BC831DRAFT_510925 [Entophlyctis helioformis]|nr:hypothetical protein BC831DRAFT_510925 [Entophlyctis helioformis]
MRTSLKFVDKVAIAFAPLSPASRSVRVVWNRLHTHKQIAENPKCQFDVKVMDKIASPFIEVRYIDKKVIKIETASLTAEEVLQDINRHSRKLQMEEDIRSSS